jgi:hypothetical protein
MKLPEFKIFFDKSDRKLLIIFSIRPNLYGSGGQLPPPLPVSYAYDSSITYLNLASFFRNKLAFSQLRGCLKKLTATFATGRPSSEFSASPLLKTPEYTETN